MRDLLPSQTTIECCEQSIQVTCTTTLTRMVGVAIFGGTSPPSWRRIRDGCMMVVVVVSLRTLASSRTSGVCAGQTPDRLRSAWECPKRQNSNASWLSRLKRPTVIAIGRARVQVSLRQFLFVLSPFSFPYTTRLQRTVRLTRTSHLTRRWGT